MSAWSRWQLDWLHERQVRCVTEGSGTVTADDGDTHTVSITPSR